MHSTSLTVRTTLLKNKVTLQFKEMARYGVWSKDKCTIEEWIKIALDRNSVFKWYDTRTCIDLVVNAIINSQNKDIGSMDVVYNLRYNLDELKNTLVDPISIVEQSSRRVLSSMMKDLCYDIDVEGYIYPIKNKSRQTHTETKHNIYTKRNQTYLSNTTHTDEKTVSPETSLQQMIEQSTQQPI